MQMRAAYISVDNNITFVQINSKQTPEYYFKTRNYKMINKKINNYNLLIYYLDTKKEQLNEKATVITKTGIYSSAIILNNKDLTKEDINILLNNK